MEKKLRILKTAKKLFAEKGFKDTNISEITKMAGMATGTFYIYYSSKDKLFMDIYLEENKKLKKRIISEINLDEHPLKVVEKIMKLNILGMQSNPILKEWYNRDNFAKIEEVYRKENGLETVDFLYDIFINLIEEWQNKGIMRKDIDSKMIMAIFQALINIDTHKDEIGIQYFPKLMDYMAEFIMKGLLVNSKNMI